MTSKDFTFIAGVISNLTYDMRERVCQEFTDHLRIVNPRFNERLFMVACRVESITIPAHRVKIGDFILHWGTVDGLAGVDEVIDISTDTTEPNEWAMSCDRNEPVRINVISQAQRMRELSAHTARRSGT